MTTDRGAKDVAIAFLALFAFGVWLTVVYLTVRVIRAAWGGN